MRPLIIVALFCMFILNIQSYAQQISNPTVARLAINDQTGYQRRINSDRFEGLYRKNVESTGLQLSGVSVGPIDYEMVIGDTLHFRSPSTLRRPLIGVTGDSFGLTRNYHLDFVLRNNEIKKVPLDAVIYRNNIYPDHLGIYGYEGNPEHPSLYIPVVLGKTIPTAPLHLLFVSDSQIVQLRYTIKRNTNQGIRMVTSGNDNSYHGVHAPIIIKLPQLIGQNLNGQKLTVRVEAKTSGSRRFNCRWEFQLLYQDNN